MSLLEQKHCVKCQRRQPLAEFPAAESGAARSLFCLTCRRARKVCRRCKEAKSIIDFARARGARIGFCKECHAEARASLYASARARQDARWRKLHGEERPRVGGHIDRDPEEVRKGPKRRRAARLKAARRAPVDREKIFERDGWRCGICGAPVDRDEASLDHIIPIARGGTHEPENVRLAHRLCNSRRGAWVGEGASGGAAWRRGETDPS